MASFTHENTEAQSLAAGEVCMVVDGGVCSKAGLWASDAEFLPIRAQRSSPGLQCTSVTLGG